MVTVYIDADIMDLVPKYLAGRRQDLQTLRQLLAAQNYAKIAAIGHRIKGSGPTYGFTVIGEIGRALEIAARQSDQAALATTIAKLASYLSDLVVQPAAAGR